MVGTNTTRELVRKAQEGDRDAFDALIARSRERVLALARTRLAATPDGPVEPEDVLQETAVRALESIARFEWRGEESFRRWLQGIAENVFRETSRKSRPTPAAGIDVDAVAQDSSPSQRARRDERFERLQDAVDQLPEDYRQVILLARIEGLKIREVAERLGRSESAVKNLLLRGMRQLRECFGDTESLHLPGRSLERKEGGDARP